MDKPMTGPLADLEAAYRCIRCGSCLPACPTFQKTGLETESPRGRIALVRAVLEGSLALHEALPHLDLCIGCRACEAACPVGVPYGSILEGVRHQTELQRLRPFAQRTLRQLAFGRLLSSPAALRAAAWAWWLLRRSGAAGMGRVLGRLCPQPDHRTGSVSVLLQLAEALPQPLPPWQLWPSTPQVPGRGRRGSASRPRVAFFLGCVQELVFARVNRAAIRVLEAAGFEVVVPPGQVCCGAVQAHLGLHAEAVRLARRNIQAFERVGADYVVTAAAGCGVALREYPARLAHGEGDGAARWVERARAFSARVRDFSELVASAGLPPGGRLEAVVTYQDSCHLRHVAGVWQAPRRLLQQIPGLRFVELPGADQCCGGGGTYWLTQPAMSRRILADKMARAAGTGAAILAVTNPPCYLQLLLGLQLQPAHTAGLQVRHIAEILEEALGLSGRA